MHTSAKLLRVVREAGIFGSSGVHTPSKSLSMVREAGVLVLAHAHVFLAIRLCWGAGVFLSDAHVC